MGFDILVYKLNQLTTDYWSTMYVLYAFALLFFGLSYLSFKKLKRGLGNIFLTLGLFFNPLGYDVIVYYINMLTKDYWMTMSIMYMLAGIFFGLFMYFDNINPIKFISDNTKKTTKLIKNKISR
jgi:hypothetical protein